MSGMSWRVRHDGWNRVESPDLPPCAGCGAGITDDEDALLVFSKADQQVAAEGSRVLWQISAN
jgi:hypothetical protein